jgi:hypothetical protein
LTSLAVDLLNPEASGGGTWLSALPRIFARFSGPEILHA